MLLLGLTGSIATGKSTVARILTSPPYSLPLIDADVLARQVVEPGTRGYRRIVEYFGGTTPDLLLPATEEEGDGRGKGSNGGGRPLDRAALGRRVFGNNEERKRDRLVLNSIVHPAVRWAMLRAILYYYIRGYWAVLLDIPLLFESGLDVFTPYVLFVGISSPAVQIARLRARDLHLSEEDARNRVLSQTTVQEKADRVRARGEGRGGVVWNDGDRGELETELGRVMAYVQRERRAWWTWWLWGSPLVAVAVAAWEVYWGWRARRTFERHRSLEKAKL